MDWREITDEKEKYAAYLCSREWSVKKQAVHERAGGICERCRRNAIDAVHHLNYLRKYDELLADLQGICNLCHEFTHGKGDRDPVRDVFKVQCEPCSHLNRSPSLSIHGSTVFEGKVVIEFRCEEGHRTFVVFAGRDDGYVSFQLHWGGDA